MKRRTAREKALQALFQVNVSQTDPNEAIEHALEEERSDAFLNQLVFGTIEHQKELDELIAPHLVNWTIERLANIDKTILRMAAYELKFAEDVPANVAIDEAVELAKAFGDDHSSKFVNGVLSKIKQNLER
ncbi:transcription antitermination factor NusB [Metabacillus halosaccharovorans]|uniref:Transcription antitermination protein NusB n=1 Tax=Metabacillus halosaccharovorans TaxID=930124 RepID=A0ABT3DMA1_9BACI|nr:MULTISPECIES: transcription antitermination factor NusB [Metabacillus]MCM3440955.1 transcription antitermination factor NusB [Metabacillus halosaccharovorans]MCV9888193.1 transcription antitermination factor NusB [Metabacillus halosaccharovorans]